MDLRPRPRAPSSEAASPRRPGTGRTADRTGPAARPPRRQSGRVEYTLSRASVAAGEVIVELNNQGEDGHNLNLQLANGRGPSASRKRLAETGSDGRFTLPAGTYRLWCSLPTTKNWG